MYKPICPKCKSQDIGELISYVDFDVNSEGSVHEWLCQGCDYSWEKDNLKVEAYFQPILNLQKSIIEVRNFSYKSLWC